MRRRKLWWVAGLAVLLAAGAFVLWPQPDRVTQENYERLRQGMSRAEVEAILGGPPGDYRTVPTHTYPFFYPNDIDGVDLYRSSCFCSDSEPTMKSDYVAAWVGNEGIVRVDFVSGVVPAPHAQSDLDLVVREVAPSKHFYPTVRREQSPLDYLLWRANRQWRRLFPEKPEE